MGCPTNEALLTALDAPGASSVTLEHLETCLRCQEGVERLLVHDEVARELRASLRGFDEPEPDVPPGYEILREIRRGGQGVVYEAYHEATCRKVALKKMLGGGWAAKGQRSRFRREVRLAAALRHPNIVTIHDAGETPDGVPYLSMDLVDGVHVDGYCDGLDGPDAFETRLALFHKIAVAVSYANRRGIVHRDLKPSNLLVDAQGEPFVLDFGLARESGPSETSQPVAGVDSEITRVGDFLGSPAWASPEQLRGESDLDERTDVYALGLILYRLMTGGRADRDGLTRVLETRSDVFRVPGTPPRRYTNDPSRNEDLDRLIAKALAPERDARYPSTEALAADVGRLIRSEAVHARPRGAWERGWRLLRSHRAIAAAVVALIAAWPVFLIAREVRASGIGRANVAAGLAALERGEHARAERALFTELLDPTANAWEIDRLRSAFERREPSARLWALRELCLEQRCVGAASLTAGVDRLTRLSWSPEGDLLAVSAVRVELLSVPELEPVGFVPRREKSSFWLHPDGRHAVSSTGRDDNLYSTDVWDVSAPSTPIPVWALESVSRPVAYREGEEWKLLFAREGGTLASIGLDSTETRELAWRAPAGTTIRELASPPSGRFVLVMVRDDDNVDTVLRVFPEGSGPAQPLWAGTGQISFYSRFSADESQIGGYAVRPLAGNGILRMTPGSTTRFASFCPGPSSAQWIGAGDDESILLYEGDPVAAEYEAVEELRGVDDRMTDLVYSDRAGLLATSDESGSVRLWRPYGPPPGWKPWPGRAADGGTTIHDVKLDAMGVLTADGEDASISFARWNAPDKLGKIVLGMGLASGVDRVVGPPTLIAAASHDARFWILRDDTDFPERLPLGNGVRPGKANLVRFRPDGGALAGVDESGQLHLWTSPFDEEARTYEVSQSRLGALAWSPDGSVLAIGGERGVFRWWKDGAVRETRSTEHHGRTVTDIAFDPAGRFCVAVDKSGRVAWWTPGREQPYLTSRYAERFMCVAVSNDGSTLFAGSQDGEVLALDADTGERLANFKILDGQLFRLAPDRNRNRLLAVGQYRTIGWLDFDELDRIVARRTEYWIERLEEEGDEPALADAARAWAAGTR